MTEDTCRTDLAVFLPSLRGGGAERSLLAVANGIAERGFAVDLLLAAKEGPYLADIGPRLQVVDFGVRRVASALPGLASYLRRVQPVTLLSALPHANVIALLAARVSGVRTRRFISERNILTYGIHGSGSAEKWLLPGLVRLTYPWADRVIAVSSGVARDLAERLGLAAASISVVYNPVVTESLVRKSHESMDHPWFRSGEPPVILGAGRLVPQKNFSLLLDAFAAVRVRRAARLVILGDGQLRNELELAVRRFGLEDDVLMPGFVANPFKWMKGASLFVLSSDFEGLPGVLIQAMACGTPVVSTDCPSGPAEILEDGRWGRLVPVGDASRLSLAINAALDEVVHPDVQLRAAQFSDKHAIDGYVDVLGLRR